MDMSIRLGSYKRDKCSSTKILYYITLDILSVLVPIFMQLEFDFLCFENSLYSNLVLSFWLECLIVLARCYINWITEEPWKFERNQDYMSGFLLMLEFNWPGWWLIELGALIWYVYVFHLNSISICIIPWHECIWKNAYIVN